MSVTTNSPTKTKGLVEFSAAKQGALAITDRLDTSDGELTHSTCRTNLEFMVQHEGYWFAVNTEQQDRTAVMKVHGIIGHLPFTYKSAFARTNILAVVSMACKEINAKLRVDDSQRILLIDEVRIKGSLTPKIILTETTKILLKLKPYLRLVTSLQPPTEVSVCAPENYKRQADFVVEEKKLSKPEKVKPKPLTQRIKKKVTIRLKKKRINK